MSSLGSNPQLLPPISSAIVDSRSTPPSLTVTPGVIVDDRAAEPTLTDPVVQLQPPITIDPARVGTVPTSAGVPDSARLIASSRRPVTSAPAPRELAVSGVSKVVGDARTALDQMTSYQLSLNRQERVGETLLPAEDLIMSIRRAPKAARLTWADGPHQGREVLYRADEPGGLMHVNMADSKLPIPRLNLVPDSPMVMKNSRHPITEAGLDPLVASMEEAARAGSLTDLGMQTPVPLDHPHHGVLRKTATGDVWKAYFDPNNHLPALVECRSSTGDLIESYRFQNIRPNLPELASNDAFDPDSRWGAPRGLFGRMSARKDDGAGTTR